MLNQQPCMTSSTSTLTQSLFAQSSSPGLPPHPSLLSLGFVPLRHKILGMLATNPPFTKDTDSALCTEALVDQLWKLMNSGERP